MKIPHLCFSIVRLVALSVVALSACAGETNNVSSITSDNPIPTNLLCTRSNCALKKIISSHCDSATNSDSNSSVQDSSPGLSGHYSLSSDPRFLERQKQARELAPPEKQSIDFSGHDWKITQGTVPLNMDPMQTDSQRELEIQEYRRVELYGDGTQKGNVFVSEAEGPGINLPTRFAPDAALFVKASDNCISLKYTSSFKHYPLEGLFSRSSD